MDNSVIVHEMTHGISNRMTGGGTVRCLQGLESKGMGEGWSDMMAEYDRWPPFPNQFLTCYHSWTEQTSSFVSDFSVGKYVMNNESGTRKHPYSVDP